MFVSFSVLSSYTGTWKSSTTLETHVCGICLTIYFSRLVHFDFDHCVLKTTTISFNARTRKGPLYVKYVPCELPEGGKLVTITEMQ